MVLYLPLTKVYLSSKLGFAWPKPYRAESEQSKRQAKVAQRRFISPGDGCHIIGKYFQVLST